MPLITVLFTLYCAPLSYIVLDTLGNKQAG
jgi:hypothetical protein